ncbi:hypothetical protein DSM106972_087920 [Dulcicalothrix desertica PCC 7102]|uniref:Uncharacterized protein n=1 Tax=Dulcicalothrix desertica PCC 7102 TaxID=232991 RepID=A0A433UQY0_9CYAN|nr:hypothetical protein [Dulcicalothrix desertica]RUS96250.1 hypothetical protein DSM106972_087920 [Dulcicalothrix desertica PCC 7102]TWH40425.1 hypothetical protein CAL7102_09752 [Dulcicalothrix desertica PCC 7102]
MNKLKIADLSFCETELSNSGEVQGGAGAYYQPVGSVSTSFSADNSAGYYGNWGVYRDTYGGYIITANVYGSVGGAAAGAASGAASDGTHYASSSAQASTY